MCISLVAINVDNLGLSAPLTASHAASMSLLLLLATAPMTGDVPLVSPHHRPDDKRAPVGLHERADTLGDDVDAEVEEGAGDGELLVGGHGGARGLLAVAESGVEDSDVEWVGDEVRGVRRRSHTVSN
ncbi:uncharacterized protein A4U43_C04F19540 [Asparagus officinalis]|uniref:Uncharacterized protein n=1 Tax=Asparagus officinalis TaxID=4686 RepID=A0A5P1F262_ASPOF|nr:uncharacterized protein A4U43_C04F19540 [Asparagus officinalis]